MNKQYIKNSFYYIIIIIIIIIIFIIIIKKTVQWFSQTTPGNDRLEMHLFLVNHSYNFWVAALPTNTHCSQDAFFCRNKILERKESRRTNQFFYASFWMFEAFRLPTNHLFKYPKFWHTCKHRSYFLFSEVWIIPQFTNSFDCNVGLLGCHNWQYVNVKMLH